jgi:hypothetical protein
MEGGFVALFRTAIKFYAQSIQNFERDPEGSYLHLITAIEILSSHFRPSPSKSIDPQTRRYLDIIETQLPDGKRIARHFEARSLQIKKRFVETILRLVDASFFDSSEASHQRGRLTLKHFEKTCAAAYDLRSQYIHTGLSFRNLVDSTNAGLNSEVQLMAESTSELAPRKHQYAPTFVGLERIVRCCLLRAAAEEKLYVE